MNRWVPRLLVVLLLLALTTSTADAQRRSRRRAIVGTSVPTYGATLRGSTAEGATPCPEQRGEVPKPFLPQCGQPQCQISALECGEIPCARMPRCEHKSGARGRSRTDTLLRAADFESAWVFPKCLILIVILAQSKVYV